MFPYFWFGTCRILQCSNPLNNHKYRPSSDTYSCSDYVSQHMTNEKRSECTYPICLNTSISICVTPLASAPCTTVSYMHTQLRTYLLGVCVIASCRSHTHTLRLLETTFHLLRGPCCQKTKIVRRNGHGIHCYNLRHIIGMF